MKINKKVLKFSAVALGIIFVLLVAVVAYLYVTFNNNMERAGLIEDWDDSCGLVVNDITMPTRWHGSCATLPSRVCRPSVGSTVAIFRCWEPMVAKTFWLIPDIPRHWSMHWTGGAHLTASSCTPIRAIRWPTTPNAATRCRRPSRNG